MFGNNGFIGKEEEEDTCWILLVYAGFYFVRCYSCEHGNISDKYLPSIFASQMPVLSCAQSEGGEGERCTEGPEGKRFIYLLYYALLP